MPKVSKIAFKNTKGSTLLMVMMVLMILSLLGVTILSIGITNYKMKIIDAHSKTAFYLSESGIEEAYGRMVDAVQIAVDILGTQKNQLEYNTKFKNILVNTDNLIKQHIEDINRPYLVLEGYSPKVEVVSIKEITRTVGKESIYVIEVINRSTCVYKKATAEIEVKYEILYPNYTSTPTVTDLIHSVYWKRIR